MRITFYGGAGKVTGSNFLVESSHTKILVDCGLEQGTDACVDCMYELFPYDAHAITALIVTHAHLDHVGRIPKLVREGFHGSIYLTPPTRDLTELILRDSVGILAGEAHRKGREQLYEEKDVDTALSLMKPIEYHQNHNVTPDLSLYLRPTGHILGSASVRMTETVGSSVAITGDIGHCPSPLLPDWEAIPDADALVIESTYGNRVHPPLSERVPALLDALTRGMKRGGTILIPAFSLERTQLMLYELSNFFSGGLLPQVPVFLDSPLAIHITELYEKWGSTYFKPETEDEMRREGSIFTFPFLTKTATHEESENIESAPDPKIIIAGSGMSHGGRITGWEARYLPEPATTVLIVGYQAPGTPGRQLVEGAKRVTINDNDIPVRATVENLEGWSAHADRDGLLQFVDAALPHNNGRTRNVFVALGEPAAERFLAQRIHDYLGTRAIVPEQGQTWEIAKETVRKV